ncbi:unnamed protein product [Sphenostylis stenocarpa]|uniref:Uncharacterized protein n=1 Tax=Sphenostylis stenocarpa TaxID=92480 RepID=A0AA86W6N8_9FABA|nr:unnamed protein product [Sphenostylis stenocarpa]
MFLSVSLLCSIIHSCARPALFRRGVATPFVSALLNLAAPPSPSSSSLQSEAQSMKNRGLSKMKMQLKLEAMSLIHGDGGDSMTKWNKDSCQAFFNFLTHKHVSIACYSCTRHIVQLE